MTMTAKCWMWEISRNLRMVWLLKQMARYPFIDLNRKYHNIPYHIPYHIPSLFVTPKFCINIVFSFSWGHFNSLPRETVNNAYEKFGVTNKEHYGMLHVHVWYSVFSVVVNYRCTCICFMI